MRLLFAAAMAAFLISCNANEQEVSKNNWQLSERKLFRTVRTKEGRPDTIFSTRYTYQNEQAKDSTTWFTTYGYEGANLKEKKYFQQDAGGQIQLLGSWNYGYDAAGRITTTRKINRDVLEQEEQFRYDDQGREQAYMIRENTRQAAIEYGEAVEFATDRKAAPEYASLFLSYQYDQQGKVIQAVATDSTGKKVRVDVNLYEGAEPLSSYSLNAKGDTIQRIRFDKDGKVYRMTVANDTLILTKWVSGNYTLAQITDDLKAGKKWKKVMKYDEEGRLAEQTIYASK